LPLNRYGLGVELTTTVLMGCKQISNKPSLRKVYDVWKGNYRPS
jgi:hypothetical protein